MAATPRDQLIATLRVSNYAAKCLYTRSKPLEYTILGGYRVGKACASICVDPRGPYHFAKGSSIIGSRHMGNLSPDTRYLDATRAATVIGTQRTDTRRHCQPGSFSLGIDQPQIFDTTLDPEGQKPLLSATCIVLESFRALGSRARIRFSAFLASNGFRQCAFPRARASKSAHIS